MILKLVMSALSLHGGSASLPLGTVEFVKKSIRTEVLGMAFKILFAVILVAVIIFSIFQVGDAARIILSQMQDGPTIQVLVFGTVTVVSLVLLFFLLRATDGSRPSSKPTPLPSDAIDFGALALKFGEGFLQGLGKRTPPEEPRL